MANDKLDPLVRKYVEARSVAAVQKTRLATLRSSYPSGLVYVFEGVDDKGVYYQWMTRLGLSVQYEAFVCGNKAMSLQLFDALSRDRSGLATAVYFFLDHDFDGLQGRPPSLSVFVPGAYSIENYLVNPTVLGALLKVNFHCDGAPAVREAVQSAFWTVYSKYLTAIAPLNFRIYLARKCAIRQTQDLPTRLNEFAVVALDSAEAADVSPEKLVALEREPTAAEEAAWKDSFAALDPPLQFRGKFCWLFFVRWLELLLVDRKREASVHFGALKKDGLKPRGGFTMDDCASKSDPPPGLAAFVQASLV